MGTHVAIDEDVVRVAEKLAREQDRELGKVISELARRSLPVEEREIAYLKGFPLLPISNPNAVVTMEHVNQLRDEAP
jgi:hypothetical protein